MAKQKSSPKKRREQKNAFIAAAAFLAGALVVGLVVWGLFQSRGEPVLDSETNCPVSGAESVTVVLIDLSEPYNEVQREGIFQRLEAVREKLETNDKLALYLLSDVKDAMPDPAFSYCKPPKGSEANPLFQNPRMMQETYMKFADKGGELRAFIGDKSGRRTSPVMEMIQIVAVKEFRKSSAKPPKEKRLVVVSDMIQNSPGYSLYKVGRPDFEAFQKTPHYQKIRTDLGGAEVSVFLVRRDAAGSIQNDDFYDFWWNFLEGMGGYPRIERISG